MANIKEKYLYVVRDVDNNYLYVVRACDEDESVELVKDLTELENVAWVSERADNEQIIE